MLRYITLSAFSLLLTTIMFSQNTRDLIIEESVHHSIEQSNLSISTILAYSNQLNQKKSEEATQRLDSVIYYSKNELTGEWDKKFHKQHFFYNDNYRDTLIIYSRWDKVNGEWKNGPEDIRKYNAKNLLICFEEHHSRFKFKTEYNYNDNDELIEVTKSKWLYDFAKWQEMTKTEKHYNSGGVLQVDTLYTKYTDSEDWILESRKVYTNNAADKVIADTIYSKRRKSDDLELYIKREYEYNSGYLEKVSKSSWDKYSNTFIPVNKTLTVYDTIEWKVQGTNKYYWDRSSKQWEIKKSLTFGYDYDNYLNSITNQVFGVDTTFKKVVYNFDYSISKNEILLPTRYANYNTFHHKITSIESINKKLEKDREFRFFYSEISNTTTTTNILNESINIYPNPAKESLYVNIPSKHNQVIFELYDIKGEKIHTSNINNGELINISMLSKGFYLYCITYGQNRSTGKLIID